jgi:hypothetical protein
MQAGAESLSYAGAFLLQFSPALRMRRYLYNLCALVRVSAN